MSAFRFPLESLLRYRRNRREQVLQVLAQILMEERRIAGRQDELRGERESQLGEIRDMGRSGTVDIDRTATRRFHAGLLSTEIAGLDQQRQLVGEQLRLCRQALAKADQDMKLLEKLRDCRRGEFEQEQERKSARALEDAWIGAHWQEFNP